MKKKICKTSLGKLELPVRIIDASNVTAFFSAPSENVQSLLSDTPLTEALQLGPYAVIALAFYENRETSIGTFNKAALAIPVLIGELKSPLISIKELMLNIANRSIGFYIADLPVTDNFADAAGHEIWGYPKGVARIPFSLKNRLFHGQVVSLKDNVPILTVSGEMGVGILGLPFNLITYSRLNNQLIRSEATLQGKTYFHTPGSVQVSVGSDNHPMTRRLNELKLDETQPLFIMTSRNLRACLHEGRPVLRKEFPRQ